MLHDTKVLDRQRRELIPLFDSLKKDFYLAGGTALALILGYRESVDFDFFSEQSFDTVKLYIRLQDIFKQKTIKKIQEEEGTLTILVDDIKISFFSYPYKILEPFIETDHMKLASLVDIGCMKLSAIASRSTIRDYVDLYFILQQKTLDELLSGCLRKYPQLDTMLILKSLVYFNDIEIVPLRFMPQKEVTVEDLKKYFQSQVKTHLK